MINKIYAIGRQVADPTQTTISNVLCANFSLASDTRNKDADGNALTNFYRVSAWGKLGDTCVKYLHKGDRVAIVGDLLFRTYKDKNGQDRAAMQVTLTDIEFLNDKPRGGDSAEQPRFRQPQQAVTKQHTPAQVTTEDDSDELPF